ncbi:unnamed protein product [Symbiodinium sp. CCMP2456]|nr:unnamed protein product [Symbiodinium sp. CCMP2456]
MSSAGEGEGDDPDWSEGTVTPRLEENALAEDNGGDVLSLTCFHSVCEGCLLNSARPGLRYTRDVQETGNLLIAFASRRDEAKLKCSIHRSEEENMQQNMWESALEAEKVEQQLQERPVPPDMFFEVSTPHESVPILDLGEHEASLVWHFLPQPCHPAMTDATGWHCVVTEHFVAGQGARQHVEFRAQSSTNGAPPQSLVFRFSQVDRLLGQLGQMSELRDVTLPRLPPKVTIRSTWAGRFDATFLQERQSLLTSFFEELCTILNGKYSAIGNVLDLCEPLGEFVASAARAGSTEELATVAAVEAAIRREEDRQIIASQDAEYEESLRQDELRRIAQAEKAEKERLVAEEEARQQKAAEEEAAALVEEQRLRRETFDRQHPLPEAGKPQATVRFRAASGATIQRTFAEDTQVSALFEFAAVADWDGPALGRPFDLRTSFPVTNLQGKESQTLREAGLCPSTMLLVAEHDD